MIMKKVLRYLKVNNKTINKKRRTNSGKGISTKKMIQMQEIYLIKQILNYLP